MGKRSLIDVPTRKRNRLFAKMPTTGKRWCGGCDCYLIGDGEKCPVCGKHERRGLKKRGELP